MMKMSNLNDRLTQKINNMMQKQAVFVKSTEVDMDVIAEEQPMLAAMIKLPKYQPLIKSLKASSGIVNFVTSGEYAPLIEMLIKTAFPPGEGDIFNGGYDLSDYALDPTKYFGARNAPKGDEVLEAAKRKLENLLLGTTKKVTRQGLLEDGWSKDMIDERIGLEGAYEEALAREEAAGRGPEDPRSQGNYFWNVESWGGDPSLKMAAHEGYWRQTPSTSRRSSRNPKLANVAKLNPRGVFSEKYQKFLDEIKSGEAYAQRLANVNAKLAEPGRTSAQIRQLRKIKSEIVADQKKDVDILNVQPWVTMYVNESKVFESPERSKDGFINMEEKSTQQIDKLAKNVVALSGNKTPTDMESLANTIGMLIDELRKFRTFNPLINKIRSEWIAWMGGDNISLKTVTTVKEDQSAFIEFRNNFMNATRRSGKVLIMDDFEDSIFCRMSGQDPNVQTPSLRDSRIFEAFKAHNQAIRHGGYPDTAKESKIAEAKKLYNEINTQRQRMIKKEPFENPWKAKITEMQQRMTGDPVINLISEQIGETPETISRWMEEPRAKDKEGRTLLLISSQPIGGLNPDKVIRFDVAKVDKEESSIIVSFNVDKEEKAMLAKLTLQRGKEAYQQSVVPFAPGQKPASLARPLSRATVGKKAKEDMEKFFKLDHLVKDRLIDFLCGLGQGEAIEIMRSTLEASIEEKKSSNPATMEEEYHEELNQAQLMKKIREEVNEKLGQSVPGLRSQTPKVTMDLYAYKKTGEWSKKIASIQEACKKMRESEASIKQLERERVELGKKIQAALRVQLRGGKEGQPGWQPDEVIKDDRIRYDKYEKIIEGQRKDLLVTADREIPHVFLLYGQPGTGKSIWAQVLANLLDLDFKFVDLTAARNRYLGETESNTRKLMGYMRTSRNTVFLLDEIDLILPSGSRAADDNTGTQQSTVASFQDFFDNDDTRNAMTNHRVYFVLTTNNVNNIAPALRSRWGGGMEVPLPDDPQSYERFFHSWLEVEKKENPEMPWFFDPEVDDTLEKQWATTFKFYDSLDWPSISKVYAQRKIGFRTLKLALQAMFIHHRQYESSIKHYAKGIVNKVEGMPFTNENVIILSGLLNSAEDETTSGDVVNAAAVDQLRSAKEVEIERVLQTSPVQESLLPKNEHDDPSDPLFALKPLQERQKILKEIQEGKRQPRVSRSLPKEVQDILTGKNPIGANLALTPLSPEEKEGEVDFVVGPDGKPVPVKKKKTPEQEMVDTGKQGLIDVSPTTGDWAVNGDEESAIDVEEQEKKEKKTAPAKNKKEKEEKGIKSSTDYYYEHLKKIGVIKDIKETMTDKEIDTSINKIAQAKPKIDRPLTNAERIERDTANGVLNYGFLMIAPATANTPPHIWERIQQYDESKKLQGQNKQIKGK